MKGHFYALAAALFFGASTPFAKSLLDRLDSVMLAGLLYLGSGLGLFCLAAVRTAHSQARSISFNLSEWLWLMAGVVVGGVLGPILLMAGLARTDAAAGSLLLNFEAAFTGLLAWWLFGEKLTRSVVLGTGLITIAGILLSISDLADLKFDLASPLIAGACLCWAIDNNLMRKVARGDALKVASLRGLLAGSINITIASALGNTWPDTALVAQSAVLGFISYGIGLAFFIVALRLLGAARAGANFAVAPFIGAAVAIFFFDDKLTAWTGMAAGLMAAGLLFLLTEKRPVT